MKTLHKWNTFTVEVVSNILWIIKCKNWWRKELLRRANNQFKIGQLGVVQVSTTTPLQTQTCLSLTLSRIKHGQLITNQRSLLTTPPQDLNQQLLAFSNPSYSNKVLGTYQIFSSHSQSLCLIPHRTHLLLKQQDFRLNPKRNLDSSNKLPSEYNLRFQASVRWSPKHSRLPLRFNSLIRFRTSTSNQISVKHHNLENPNLTKLHFKDRLLRHRLLNSHNQLLWEPRVFKWCPTSKQSLLHRLAQQISLLNRPILFQIPNSKLLAKIWHKISSNQLEDRQVLWHRQLPKQLLSLRNKSFPCQYRSFSPLGTSPISPWQTNWPKSKLKNK